MIKSFKHAEYVGIQRLPINKQVVHIFDLDDTLSLKPEWIANTTMTKDQFFDAARDFPSDEKVAWLARFLVKRGDAIAVCTARPAERLCESYQWLMRWRIPFDVLMLSTGNSVSSSSKQHMIKYLRRKYNRVGTLFDDSIYNVKGARLQNIGAIHIPKNEPYWTANPELVEKV